MKHMQPGLAVNVVHRLVRGVWWSLVHNNHQVPLTMVLQHLLHEADHFLRRDTLFVQLKNQPTMTIDRRHGRYPTTLARDFLARSLPTRCPRLAQKGRQRDIRFVLKVQQSVKFPHGFADFRGFDPHPFFAGFLVHLEVLTLGFLIRQTGLPQTPPNRVEGSRGGIFLLNDPMQAANRPQIRFKSKSGSGQENDFPQSTFVEVFQQPRPTASPFRRRPSQPLTR